jgi:cellobiose phosphorylase
MYRVGLECILGFTKQGDTLSIRPRVPSSWPGYVIEYRYGSTLYVISVKNEDGAADGAVEVTVDGNPAAEGAIKLVDDGGRHEVAVVCSAQAAVRMSS